MEIRALTPAEQKYTYAQSVQLEGQTANIGHLRGDFDSSGYGFYTTWTDTRTQWKTDEFKTEFDEVINALRSDKYGLLKSRSDMSAYMVSSRYGVDTRGFNFSRLPKELAETDTQTFKGELGSMRDVLGEIQSEMYKSTPVQSQSERDKTVAGNEGGSVRTTVGVKLPWCQFAADRLATSQ